jgi:hypothetical protein
VCGRYGAKSLADVEWVHNKSNALLAEYHRAGEATMEYVTKVCKHVNDLAVVQFNQYHNYSNCQPECSKELGEYSTCGIRCDLIEYYCEELLKIPLNV